MPLRNRLLLQEDLNFLLTNRLSRHAPTRFMGWFSKIRNPWVCRASPGVWRLFTDLDLSDATKQHFESLHDCFTRELEPGARSVDMDAQVLASPCDAIVGACGPVVARSVVQAKGSPSSTQDLFGRVEHVNCLGGDTWNVDPIALKRVERLFCRNERAVIRMRLAGGQAIRMGQPLMRLPAQDTRA